MNLGSFTRTIVVVSLSLLCPTVMVFADDGAAGWNKAEAGRYLDERAKTWFAFASADRGEQETKTSCVSCHTVGPYALARPALRRLTGTGQATEFEVKLLAQTKMRVEHWEELESPKYRLLYDSDEQKTKEGWGTEAVFNALTLAFDDRNSGRAVPSDSTRRALANLWRTQLTEGDHRGSWDWLNFGLEPWESANGRYYGATLAAIAIGTAPGYYVPGADVDLDRNVDLLRRFLKDHRAEQNTFNRIWLLWAAHRLDGLLTRDEIGTIVGEVLEAQQSDGGWRLASLGAFTRRDGTPQETASDGYATGLVLHVLQTAGLPKDNPKIASGLSWLRANQSPTGEWRATSVNKKRDPATHVGRFMSDAATAFAILALSH